MLNGIQFPEGNGTRRSTSRNTVNGNVQTISAVALILPLPAILNCMVLIIAQQFDRPEKMIGQNIVGYFTRKRFTYFQVAANYGITLIAVAIKLVIFIITRVKYTQEAYGRLFGSFPCRIPPYNCCR